MRFTSDLVLKWILGGLLLSFSLLVLIWPALDNGFPLVYPDTGAYIASGSEGHVPVDRPILYGVFIRHTGMLHSLWMVVTAQALIFLYLLYRTIRFFSGQAHPWKIFLMAVFISVGTTCGYYTGQIMPDIFSAYMWWSLALIVVMPSLDRWDKILLFFVLLLSASIHFSNFLSLIIFALASGAWFVYRRNWKQLKRILILAVLPFLITCAVNLIYEHKIFFAKTSSVFFTAKLNAWELVKPFLDKNCGIKNYELCWVKDSIPPTLEHFLWGPSAIPDKYMRRYDVNYESACWKMNEGCGELNRAILLDPEFRARFLELWYQQAKRQFTSIDADNVGAFGYGSPPHYTISQHLKGDLNQYELSKQSHSQNNFDRENIIQDWTIRLSLLYLFVLILLGLTGKISVKKEFWWMLIILIAAYLINVLIVSYFTTHSHRFCGRLVFLFPLMAGMDLFIRIENYLTYMAVARRAEKGGSGISKKS